MSYTEADWAMRPCPKCLREHAPIYMHCDGLRAGASGLKQAAPTGTEALVCADIARRQQLGIAKYGQTVADNPLALRAWLQHAYEEVLDQAVYLRRAIQEIDANSQGT